MAAVNSLRIPQSHLAPAEPPGFDLLILVPTLVLVGLGIAMVFSASIPLAAAQSDGNVYGYLLRQGGFAFVGLLAMLVMSYLPLSKIRRYAGVGFAISTVLLLAVLLVGSQIRGAKAWFVLPFGLRFQPSEFAKLALIVASARYLAKFPNGISTWKQARSPLLMLAVTVGLIGIEPDMGTAAVVAVFMFVYYHIAGLQLRQLGAFLGLGALAAIAMIIKNPYQLDRLTGFIGRGKAVADDGYQITQCLIALGSGGLTGRGYCGSVWKYFYLPEAVNDSILAVIGEELGALFTLGVVVLFTLIVRQGMRTAAQAPDRFAGLVATGVTCLIGVQALLNIAVTTHLVPATGVTLPFVSYGGSSLVFSLAAMGLLLNVSRHRLPEGRPVGKR